MSLLKFESKRPLLLYGYNNKVLLDGTLAHPINSNTDASGMRITGWNLNSDFEFALRYKFHKSSDAWNTLIGTTTDWEFYLETNVTINGIAFRIGNASSWKHDTYYRVTDIFTEGKEYDVKVVRSNNTFNLFHRDIAKSYSKIGEITITDALSDMTNKTLMLGRSHLTHYPIAGSYWTDVGGIYLDHTGVTVSEST